MSDDAPPPAGGGEGDDRGGGDATWADPFTDTLHTNEEVRRLYTEAREEGLDYTAAKWRALVRAGLHDPEDVPEAVSDRAVATDGDGSGDAPD